MTRIPSLAINLGDDGDELEYVTAQGTRCTWPLGPDGAARLGREHQKVLAWCAKHPGIELRRGALEHMAPELGLDPVLISPLAIMVAFFDEQPRWQAWAEEQKSAPVPTGRWIRCPDCRDVVQARVGCETCGGSGDIPEMRERRS